MSAAPPEAESQAKMDIAWRYQNLPVVKSGFSNNFGHFYDLSKIMDHSRVHQVPITALNASHHHDNSLHELNEKINEVIAAGNFSTTATPLSERNILRILVSSLGSPLWSEEQYNNPVLLSQFLHSLRASVRGAYTAAIVTVPNHLLQVEKFANA